MKSVLTLLLLLVCANVQGQSYKLAKEADLSLILKNADRDSVEKIERMAAYEFHKLLNQYRKENKKDTLKWNDLFWLCSRNHNLYLLKNEGLTHTQTKGKKNFSGEKPGDRLNYVQGQNTRYAWTGENCLYNFSGYGKTVAEIAKNIAKESINQWKNSPGHNENMLSTAHTLHGVAFTLSGSQVYGTDLFGYSYHKTTDVQNNGSPKEENPKPEAPAGETVKINLPRTSKELANSLTERIRQQNNKIQVSQPLNTTAKKHLDERIATRTQATASVSKRQTKKRKTSRMEVFVSMTAAEADYDNKKVLNQLWEKLDISPQGYTHIGLSVKIRRSKGQLEIYAVLLLEK